jgi:hypothetical protein
MKKMVLFHKTPALWSKLFHVEQAFLATPSPLEQGTLEGDSEIFSLFQTDIYIRLCESICHYLGIEELHVVQGYSEDEQRNWINGETKGQYQINDLSVYWCVDNPKELLNFMDADVIFTRGNYQYLHRYLHERRMQIEKPIWVHYPATALMFPHFSLYEQKFMSSYGENSNVKKTIQKQITGMCVEHQLPHKQNSFELESEVLISNFASYVKTRRYKQNVGPYDIVLVDDNTSIKSYEQIYNNSVILNFTKPANQVLLDLKYNRKYDLLFCGTTLQPTKNHMQFIGLLDRLDRELETSLRVAVAGNKEDIPAFSNGLGKQYEHITIDDYGELPRNELFELFNETRNLVIVSGRDSNPRIIQEAGVCGVSIIVADTLSDGLEVFHSQPLLGTVIPTKKSSWFYQRNGNLLFEVNGSFATKVLSAVNAANSPYLVRKIASELYSMAKTCESISTQINSLG